jgi:hypothetical protein
MQSHPLPVIPAKAGIHARDQSAAGLCATVGPWAGGVAAARWIPAFAGMTGVVRQGWPR